MDKGKIKIGVLFSQSGSMSVTENAHLQGTLLAIEKINTSGGIDGKLLDPIIMNPQGDDQKYAEMATELLLKDRVNFIFGCCLSSSRKAVLPIVERLNGILFYPSVYEGFEYSPNVIYGGATPNQLVIPLLEYIYAHHGQRIGLLGSDTLYAREINRIVKEFVTDSDGDIIGESYLPFGTSGPDMKAELRKVFAIKPDVIISTVVGQDSVTFYDAHAALSEGAANAPIASLTTMESELAQLRTQARAGHIAVAAYFGSMNTPQNILFRKGFEDRYGGERSPSVYAEVAYSLVHFFAEAFRLSGSSDTDNVLSALSGAVFKAPGGDLSIDLDTNHFTLRPHVAVSNADGSYEIVWRSKTAVRPDPYLITYNRSVPQPEVAL
ncbi:transporter substrate-binding domain-containing protein [Octadecabacter sp. G9-8]|uniref:Transporter substrate-binding domain-containing protein n=1 Tax=Octadecabacter dasysiphoniae TaxID=2909341 RepID=A0ABS9CYM2_9RHOB|nr:transporter substrate-binding domain-containing protein [Octadecabacter dasysiphoniae]MCF2871991.1 transporter substrate-binding domain-containing protein [Octadecabacter dasysiphoniae]